MIELLKIFVRMLLRNIGLWISLILAVCFFSLGCCFSDDGNFSDLYINLAASFFAALLTIVLIEGVKEKLKDKQDLPIRTVAYREVQIFFMKLATFWMMMYYYSHPKHKNGLQIEDVFNLSALNDVRAKLNIQLPGPTTDKRLWFSYINQEHDSLIAAGNKILDRYAHILPPDLYFSIFHTTSEGGLLEYLSGLKIVRGKIKAITVLGNFCPPIQQKDLDHFYNIQRWCKQEYHYLRKHEINVLPCNDFNLIPENPEYAECSVMTADERERQIKAGLEDVKILFQTDAKINF